MNVEFKTRIGIQGGVMGWLDPWHADLCATMMRTGEGRIFPPQDPAPSVEAFIERIRSLGADFYMHHAMPEKDEIDKFIESIKEYDIDFMIGNEYGCINGPFGEESNRYDIPIECVRKALETGRFMGLIYDETEHLQLHPTIYLNHHPGEVERNPRRHQWAVVDGMTLHESEDAVSDAVKE